VDIARIIVIVALIVTFLVVMKYVVRAGCFILLAALVALIAYLWATGTVGRIGDFFKKKDGRKAVTSVSGFFAQINGG